MKLPVAAIAAALLGLSLPSSADSLPSMQRFLDVGTGNHTSFFSFESPKIGLVEFAVHYDYVPDSGQDGYFLMGIIVDNSSLSADPIVEGGTGEENYFLSALTYNGITETTPPYEDSSSPFFNQYVSGGKAGFPTASEVATGEWTFGSGASAPYREVVPGSHDAFVFGPFGAEPSFAPVPEPSTALLSLVAIGLMATRRRK